MGYYHMQDFPTLDAVKNLTEHISAEIIDSGFNLGITVPMVYSLTESMDNGFQPFNSHFKHIKP